MQQLPAAEEEPLANCPLAKISPCSFQARLPFLRLPTSTQTSSAGAKPCNYFITPTQTGSWNHFAKHNSAVDVSAAALYLLLLHQTDTRSLLFIAKWIRSKNNTRTRGDKSTLALKRHERKWSVGLSYIMACKQVGLWLMSDILSEKVNTKTIIHFLSSVSFAKFFFFRFQWNIQNSTQQSTLLHSTEALGTALALNHSSHIGFISIFHKYIK